MMEGFAMSRWGFRNEKWEMRGLNRCEVTFGVFAEAFGIRRGVCEFSIGLRNFARVAK